MVRADSTRPGPAGSMKVTMTSLDLDLDLLHLLATAAADALPSARMRAVLDRELARFQTVLAAHFRTEEEVAARTGDAQGLALSHAQLTEHLSRVRALPNSAPVREVKAALIELLDALGDHERREAESAEHARS